MIKKENALLVVIDLQEKLMPAMSNREMVIEKSAALIEGIKALNVPKLVTTQYSKGLGGSVSKIEEAFGDDYAPIDKRTFSVIGCEEFVDAFKAMDRKQIIVIGTETHICVQQSVLTMLDMGYEVYLVADCVASRSDYDKSIALERMRQAGAVITTYESVLYEMLLDSRAPEFKAITAIVK